MFTQIRYALRQLRESPGFAATAILTLTIGIGSVVAIFAVLDAVLLAPLPFPQPDRLVAIGTGFDQVVSIPTMQDYFARSKTFAGLAAYRSWWPSQKPTNGTTANLALVVSQDFFSTLGTQFDLGGSWPITGNEQDCSSQAVVSGAYWKRLGGGREIGNTKLNLDGRDFPVIGVLPLRQTIEGGGALNQPEVFVQLACDIRSQPTRRGQSGFQLLGRLRPGVTIAQASADLERVDRSLQKDYPNDYTSYRAAFRKPPQVVPYLELLVGADTKPALYATIAACSLLLLIACSNLANLLLARNTRRRGEFAVRATLGASHRQLLRQLIVESAVLVSFGVAGGSGLAELDLNLLKVSTSLRLPRLAHASLSPSVLAFTVLLAAGVSFFLALLPAWRTLRPGLLLDMQGIGRSSAGRSLRLAGRLLVVAQLSLSMVLIACAGWMVSSVYVLLHQPLGFEPDHLLMSQTYIGANRIFTDAVEFARSNQQSELQFTQMAASLRQLPGVRSVAFADHEPLGHFVNQYDFCSDQHPDDCRQMVNMNPNSFAISPNYFSTIGQALLAGRDFNAADDGRNHVVIVNQALAQREWPGQSALGHRIKTGEIRDQYNKTVWAEVVGVVGNVHDHDLVAPPRPDVYVPRAEKPGNSAKLLIRVDGDPANVMNAARLKLNKEFPSTTSWGFKTFAEEMSSEVAERVFLMQVAMAFGTVALFLSLLGTYGLLAYEVSLREKEIGIRLALGSPRERIVRLLLHEEGRWIAAGTCLGLACAVATGYGLRAQFYGAHSTSLPVLVCSGLLLLCPALLAIAIPARRASLQDPAHTLRRE